MAHDRQHKFCKTCGKSTFHYRKATNHILHLLISFLLCGFWLPVWFMLAFKIGGWRCEGCGKGRGGLLQLGAVAFAIVGFLIVAGTIANKRGASTSNAPVTQAGYVPDSPKPEPPAERYQLVATSGKFQLVYVPLEFAKDESVYRQAINDLCPGNDYAYVRFWNDVSKVPARMPMTDEQVEAQVAGYDRNPTSGLNEFYWIKGGSRLDGSPDNQPKAVEPKPAEAAPVAEAKPEPLPPEIKAEPMPRTWSSRTGKFKIEATFVERTATAVKLRKADGKVATVPIERLSQADLDWLKENE